MWAGRSAPRRVAARGRDLSEQEKERRMDFYQGKILRMDWARLYVGGKGLLFRYLLDELGVDWRPGS